MRTIDTGPSRLARAVGCAALLAAMTLFALPSEATWNNTPEAENNKENLSAGGITGPVGYLDDKSAVAGTSMATYGVEVSGVIVEQAADNLTKGNKIEQKWVWPTEDGAHAGSSVEGKIDQDPGGSGASTIQGGTLASSFVSKLHSVTFAPLNGTSLDTTKHSLSEELNNNDTYEVDETHAEWKRTITVASTDHTVRLTGNSVASGNVNGAECTIGVQNLKLTMTLTLPQPGN